MKCIIAGSRDIVDYSIVKEAFNVILKYYDISAIISGTAKGVDRLGEQIAEEYHKKIIKMPADWDKYGKRAGYLRNLDMADVSDIALIIWDEKSKGTKHMINIMRQKNKPCIVKLLCGKIYKIEEDKFTRIF